MPQISPFFLFLIYCTSRSGDEEASLDLLSTSGGLRSPEKYSSVLKNWGGEDSATSEADDEAPMADNEGDLGT